MARDLLFRRSGGIWCVMLQYKDPWLIQQFWKKKEISLKTKDKREAQILAMPFMVEHHKRLKAAQDRRLRVAKTINQGWMYPIGRSTLENGAQVMADEHTAWIKEPDGSMREVPNSLTLVSSRDPDEPVGDPLPENPGSPDMQHFKPAKPVRKVDADHALYEDWISERKPSKYIVGEAEKAFALFKAVTNGMMFKDAYRPDAMKLVTALQAKDMKNATVNKHLSHMRSICSLAVLNGKLKHNCFARLTLDPKKDALVREPFDEDQMKLVRDNLHTFDPQVAKLWVFLAATGARLSEPWDITSEKIEHGIRKVRIGTKTAPSDRWIPLPQAYLDRYPEKITGPIFDRPSRVLGEELLVAFRALGIDDPKIVNHSLRHRAKDRLRAANCPKDVQEWLLGHEAVTAADGYGNGPPMANLQPWIEKIGY